MTDVTVAYLNLFSDICEKVALIYLDVSLNSLAVIIRSNLARLFLGVQGCNTRIVDFWYIFEAIGVFVLL